MHMGRRMLVIFKDGGIFATNRTKGVAHFFGSFFENTFMLIWKRYHKQLTCNGLNKTIIHMNLRRRKPF